MIKPARHAALWHFGGCTSSPDKLDPKVLLRGSTQAMNLAINRQAIAQALLGGRVEPLRVHVPSRQEGPGRGSEPDAPLKRCTATTHQAAIRR